MDQAKVAIQNGAFSFAVEGREEFVRELLQKWETSIPQITKATGKAIHPTPAASEEVPPYQASEAPSTKFENVFDKVDSKLKIIAQMPGSSKAERARSTTLVFLYGHYLDGAEQVPSEAIRDACTDQGCFDTTNFSKHIKRLGEKVVMNVKPGGSYDMKLTAPGRRAAKELVESING